jgi:chromosome partitioning protein
MRKICISLSKGGVAKSTSSVSIAHGLAIAGKKTLVIDTDDQGQDAFLLGVQPKSGLSDVLEERIPPLDACCEARENLFILAGGKELSGLKRSISRQDFSAESTLSNTLLSIGNFFDFVLVDTSPAWDPLTINALFYCSEVISPVSLEILSLNSLAEFEKRLESVRRFTLINRFHIMPTFSDGRVKKSKEILKLLEKHYPTILYPSIRYCSRISEASGFGKTIFEYAPKSSGAIDYQRIVDILIND